MGTTESHLAEARRRFKDLQTTTVCSSPDDVARQVGYMRDELKNAGATLTTIGLTEHAVKEAVRATHLRSARKELNDLETTTTPHDAGTADHYISCIRKHLEALGQGPAALDPTGVATDAEIEERFTAGKRRICLQKARYDLKDFEKSTCAGWGPLTEGLMTSIRRNVERACESLAALDPTGLSTDTDLEKRMTQAERRLQFLYLQSQLAEAEKTSSCHSLYGAFNYRDSMMKMLEKMGQTTPGIGLEAADATGQSSAAEIAARLTLAEHRLCKLGAHRVVGELEKLGKGEKILASGYAGLLKDLDKFMEHTGGQKGLAAAGSAEEKRIAGIITAACFEAGAEELKAFEQMRAPKSLREIEERADRIADLFNRASLPDAAGVVINPAGLRVGKDAFTTVQERMDEAGIRARDLYYAAGGKLPVMKRIKLARPAGSAA